MAARCPKCDRYNTVITNTGTYYMLDLCVCADCNHKFVMVYYCIVCLKPAQEIGGCHTRNCDGKTFVKKSS
jgi:hypothetical protein